MYRCAVLLILVTLCSVNSYEPTEYDDVAAIMQDVMARMDAFDAQPRDSETIFHGPRPFGHQYVSGGAGEGKQHLTPEGLLSNPHEVKTDANLPAYCDPPNPCPIGFKEKDGCLEDVPDTADFARKYQEQQDCLCDAEHMFKCPEKEEYDHVFAGIPYLTGDDNSIDEKKSPIYETNPFLAGERLPISAKKAPLPMY